MTILVYCVLLRDMPKAVPIRRRYACVCKCVFVISFTPSAFVLFGAANI